MSHDANTIDSRTHEGELNKLDQKEPIVGLTPSEA